MNKLGIKSKVKYSQQWTKPPGSNTMILSDQYSLEVYGIKHISKFIKVIGSNHPDKNRKIMKMLNNFRNKKKLSSKYEFAPKISETLIKKIRIKVKLSQKATGFENKVWKLENYIGGTSVENVIEILNSIKKLKPDVEKLDEYKQLMNILTTSYNLNVVISNKQLKDQKMLEFKTNNRILTDTGVVVDD